MSRLWRPRSWVDRFPARLVFVPAKGEPVPGGIGPSANRRVALADEIDLLDEPPVTVEAAQEMLRELRRLWLREAAARVEALDTRILDDTGTSYSRWVNRRDALAAIMRDDA